MLVSRHTDNRLNLSIRATSLKSPSLRSSIRQRIGGQACTLTGFQALSFPEVAAMLFEKSGPRHPISAGELSEVSKTHLRGRGLRALQIWFRPSATSNYECQLLVRALRGAAYASVKCSRTSPATVSSISRRFASRLRRECLMRRSQLR